MFTYVEPPNEKIQILVKILKVLCLFTLIIGLFKFSSQKLDSSSGLYFFSGLLYFLSWRGLSYFYCLLNEVINISIIFYLLQEVILLSISDGQIITKWSLSNLFFRKRIL